MEDELKNQIQQIVDRNKKVELNKAWETSWVRRSFILVMTFIFASIWLFVIGEDNVFLKAIIPSAGYLLSTLSIAQLRKVWMRNK